MSDYGRGIQKKSGQSIGLGGNPQQAPRTKAEEMTDRIDSMALESNDRMTSMALQAMEDAMRSRDLDLRLKGAKAYLQEFHHPKQRVDVNVNEQITISQEARDAADKLTDEERKLVQQFESFLPHLRPADIEDAEVVEEVVDSNERPE